MKEGVAPSEIIQMKKQIILAAMILKEKSPASADALDRVINSFPGIEKPILSEEQ
jgi:hypothetical protein